MSKNINYYQKLLLADIAKLLGAGAPATPQPASFPVVSRAQVDKARAAIEDSKPKPVPFSGLPGYSERGAPDTWDTAMGEVYGYRYWYLCLPPAAVGYIDYPPRPMMPLTPVLYGANNQPWEDGRAEARCTKKTNIVFTMVRAPLTHEPPEIREACGCGFWAYFNKGLEVRDVISTVAGTFPYLFSRGAGIPVFGVVKGTGRVIIGEKGFRSQYAQIMGLCLPQRALNQLGWWISGTLMHSSYTTDIPPGLEQCSLQEHSTRVSEIEGILATQYPSAKLFSSQDLLTRYFPPDKNYA